MRLGGDPASRFHRLHPIAGLEFDYDTRCDTCRHYVKPSKHRPAACARFSAPFDLPGENPAALPGCTEHTG